MRIRNVGIVVWCCMLIASAAVPARAEGLNKEELAYFADIVLGAEYGNQAKVIKKWMSDITISVQGKPTAEDMRTLKQVVLELNLLVVPALRISLIERDGNIQFHFIPESRFSEVVSGYVPTNLGFFWVWWNNRYEIYQATVLITTKGVTQKERNHLIREELTQSLGLMNDSYQYKDSIFYQGWTATQRYAEIDKKLIRFLYQRTITSGMTRAQIRAMR